MNVWLLFVIMGLGTFAFRFSFIYLLGKIQLPGSVKRALRFVPPTVLMSLILPAVSRPGGVLDFSLENERLYAAVLAGFVAYSSRNVFLTIGVGMGALFLLRSLF